ncbi:MAG: glycosyltransferase N-terminal domain-containing protein, partial [Flavobacteriales bacterium]
MGWRDRWAIALLCWASRGYMALLRCAAWLGHRRAVEWVGMREGEDENEVEGEGRVVWVHCASLGEYEQGRPVIEAWRARFPEDAVLLTFFSPSGFRPLVARRPPWFRAGDRIAALPADVPRNVEAFLDRWGARLRYAVFVKY